MAKKKFEPEINLLPQEEFQASTLGRTLRWLLTTFRYIVIATEMIVMAAFLSRFALDARSSDLIDAINQKKSIISSYSTFESQFRTTQVRLKTYASYANENQKVSPVIDNISSLLPSDITLTEINIDGAKIQISAQTQNENSASNFISSLNSSNLLSNANIQSIESKAAGQSISFTVAAGIKERSQGGS
jgi:Tfp pilus assembly protein PilN